MSKPISVVIGHRSKRVMGWVAFLAVVVTCLAGALHFHQSANAAPVEAIWKQPTVTVDDVEVARVAQQWGAPFRVVHAPSSAACKSRVLEWQARTVEADRTGGERPVFERPEGGCADVVVTRGVSLPSMVGGVASRDESGDRIVGCALQLGVEASEFVMVHEVGHCLGYAGHSHAGKGVSVMAQYGWDASPVVTDADRAELAALYAGGAR